MDLCASGYDSSYLVYTGTSGNLTLVAANDFNEPQCGAGFRSYGTFESDGTTTYYITVTGYNVANTGDVDLTVSCEEFQPTPNTINLAIPIVPLSEGMGCPSSDYTFDLDFTNSGTTDSGLSGCVFGDLEGIDQFFTWTATTNGLKYKTPSFVGRAGMIIRNANAPYDVIDCTAANEDNSAILTGWNVGDNLIIQVYKNEGQTGTADARFCLEEKTIISPPNDTVAGAIPITPGLVGSDCSATSNNQTVFFNTNTYTTTDSGTGGICTGEDTGVDQFFTWTATSTGLLFGQNEDGVGITISSTSGIVYACVLRGGSDPIKMSGWQLGDELIIQIFNIKYYHYDSLTFCLREYNTSVNDLITGAIPIIPGGFGDDCSERTLSFSTDGTTNSRLDGTCNTVNTGYDQFFTWTATTNALSWSGLLNNPGIIIRDTAGNEITCVNTIVPDNTILSGWEVGDELIIQIYDWVFASTGGIYANNVEDSYRDVSFCLKEHVITRTFVPDDNFEQALIDLGYDDVLDDYVLTGNINTITSLDVSDKNIADLTGIEDFENLEELDCQANGLTSLNVSQNLALKELRCGNGPAVVDNPNQITSLDVSLNTNLEILECDGNPLNTLDVSLLTNLVTLNCNRTSLTNLNVSQNTNLDSLSCGYNSLTSLDTNQNALLRFLYVISNQLTTLNVSNNPLLQALYAGSSPYTTLDVSANPNLLLLWVDNTQLTNLDISNNPLLQRLFCSGISQLTSLNAANGANEDMITFSVFNNPNLSCVDVDDVAYSTTNWTSIDTGLTFSLNCNPAPIPPNDECVDAIDIPISDGGCNTTISGTIAGATDSNVFNCFGSADFSDVWFSFVATETAHDVRILNTSGTNARVFHAVIDAQTYNCGNITDAVYCTDSNEGQATGLIVGNTYFVQVYTDVVNSTETFDICVASLAIPGQTYVPDDNFEQALIDLGYDITLDDYVTTTNINTLEILSIDSRNIGNLTGIEDFTALEQLYVGNNPLGSLNLTQNTALILLNANNTSLSTIDLTQNTALQYLSIESNQLTAIDITQNTALITASFQSNQLATIDVSQNTVLETLNLVLNAQFFEVDVSANSSLRTLNMNFTQVQSIDVSDNPNLESLLCANCPLEAIDVSANPTLKILSVGGTQVPFVDLSNNPVFEDLFANNCFQLTGINIQNGNNTNVTSFFASNVPNLTCVQVDNVAYSTTNWTNVGAGTNFSIDCGFLENDECVNAIDIPISNGTCNNVIAATMVGATDSNSLKCFGNNANFADAWFSFVATETTHKIALQNLAGSPSFLWHSLIDAQTYTCGNITDAIYCTDGLENTATGLTIGNTYYIQVYSHVANANTTFDICVSTNTIPGLTYVPDNNFEQALIDLSLDDVLDDYVVTSNINTVNDLNIRDLGIFDLTGIEDFAALEILNCGLNFLGELDLSQNTNLNYLIADNSGLVALNVKNGNNTNVTTFITLGNVDLFCVEVDDAAYSTTNWTLIESETNFSEYCGNPIQVAAKVYLQGAMLQNTDGFMRTDLKDNNYVSAASSPYADGISMSNEVFNATQINRIVDWVWVELRDATDPTIIIDGKSAILQSGGDIVDATANDIDTPISFSQAPGDYYIVIKHRNHLGIMSSSTFSLSNVVTTVDFTNGNNQITYGTNAQTTFGMPTNTVGMWSGNVNGDTAVQYSGTTPDAPAILSKVLNDAGNFLNFPTYTVSGYDSNDVNMDGNTQYTGTNPDTPFILQNILTHPGNFLNFSTYQIIEQLPENE